MFIIFGEALQFTADHSKYLFQKKKPPPRDDGKIYMGGVFSVVRHPNFLGFSLRRFAFSVACGGLVWDGAIIAMLVDLFVQTSVPGLESYLAVK
jgi:steroid 5-alpha reductase family enzyme